MTILTLAELENKKATSGIKEVLTGSFEYLLAGVCAEYSRIKSIDQNDITAFNARNNLSFFTALSYPFFIALSNGHSKSLYKLFGDFYAVNLGPISMSLYTLLSDYPKHGLNILEHFSIDLSGHQSLKVTSSIVKPNFVKIQEAIKNKTLTVKGESCKFSDVKIYSEKQNESPIFSAIDSGIKAIKEQSGDTFFDAELRSISFPASYFKEIRRANASNRPIKLEYDLLEKAEQRPYYSYDKEIAL